MGAGPRPAAVREQHRRVHPRHGGSRDLQRGRRQQLRPRAGAHPSRSPRPREATRRRQGIDRHRCRRSRRSGRSRAHLGAPDRVARRRLGNRRSRQHQLRYRGARTNGARRAKTMSEPTTNITIGKQVHGYWRATLNNPPINTIHDRMYDEVFDLVEAIEAEPALKVITFESANPDFFLAHYGIGESTSRFGKPRWREAALRLAHSNVVSIAVIRGRTRAGGDEFALACDIRFASREKAVFGQPEVG